MLLKLLIVVAVGVSNAQTENAVTPAGDTLRQQEPLDFLAQVMVQMTQHPIYRPILQRYFYNLSRYPQYHQKMVKIFLYLRFPQPSPNIVLTRPIVQVVVEKLRDPAYRDDLIDAFLSTLGANNQLVHHKTHESPWPDITPGSHKIAHLIVPLFQDPPFFQAVAYQITQLLMDPKLKTSWVQFMLKFEAPLGNRKALLRALYSLIDIPEAKQFVIHAIVLSLQHPHLRPIFMKQFFEMLLSRTIQPGVAMQMLKILYNPMTEEELVTNIVSVLEVPRIRYRITGMVLNIFFEPRLRELVIGIVLDVMHHPMFFPIVLYHTQQIMIHLVNDPPAMDYVLAILRVPQARLIVIKFVLLVMRQPVQVSYMQALMQQDAVLNQFMREVFNMPEVRPVALAIFGVRQLLNSPAMYGRLVPYVINLLRHVEVRVYVSSYLLNLYYQPSLTSVMQGLLPQTLISEFHAILTQEISEKQVYVQSIKFLCEKLVTFINPQTQIPVIPLPIVHAPPPPPPPPPPAPVALPIPIVMPPMMITSHAPEIPVPEWVIPRPPLAPVPFCPPPMVIKQPVYVPMMPKAESVAHMTSDILGLVQQHNYKLVQQSIYRLVHNPATQHQAVMLMLQQPVLRPFLFHVLEVVSEEPKFISATGPMLLAAFRKVAQQTFVFRDVLMDRQMFAKFNEILVKITHGELQPELYKFWLDLIKNSGLDPTMQRMVTTMLRARGMGPHNLERIGEILRKAM